MSRAEKFNWVGLLMGRETVPCLYDTVKKTPKKRSAECLVLCRRRRSYLVLMLDEKVVETSSRHLFN